MPCEPPAGPGPSRAALPSGRSRGAALVALAIFLASALWIHRDAWWKGPREHLPSQERERGEHLLLDTDQTFLVWQVSRNARALVTRPLFFFDSGHCHPIPNALAYTSPMVALGILAIPAVWLGAGPVLTFNILLLVLPVLKAFAMYALIQRWSAVPAAGIAAGLAYAFHPLEVGNTIHPHIHDTTWTVFAMGFAQRLFAEGRWRDALGLAASAALQIGADFYPLVAAVLLAAPFGAWLLYRYGFRRVRPAQLAFVAAAVALAAIAVLGPAVGLRSAGGLVDRPAHYFAWWVSYLPGRPLFFGAPCLALALCGLALPRKRVLGEGAGDPRLALLAGGLLAAAVAAGPSLGTGRPELRGIDLWGALAAVLPGFSNVRNPRIVAEGAHLAACALAGLGCAGLARSWHWRGSAWLAACLAALVGFDTLALGTSGAAKRRPGTFRLGPDAEEIAFFEALAAQGNEGPIFEIPLGRPHGKVAWSSTVRWIYRAGFHGRRTSSCFGAQMPRLEDVVSLEARLPERDAIRALRELGFTTIIFHRALDRGSAAGEAWRGPRLPAFEREARAPGGLLERVHEGSGLVAFSIE